MYVEAQQHRAKDFVAKAIKDYGQLRAESPKGS